MKKILSIVFTVLISGCSVGSDELELSQAMCRDQDGKFSLSADADGRIMKTFCTIGDFQYRFFYLGNGKGYYSDPRVSSGY